MRVNKKSSARGLVAKALYEQARAKQALTGQNYSSAWYETVGHLASGSHVESDNEREGNLQDWIYSIPLEELTSKKREQQIERRPVIERTSQETVVKPLAASVAEVFASLADQPPQEDLAAYLSQLAVAAYQDKDVLEPLIVAEGAGNFSWFEQSGSAAFGCVFHGHPIIAFRGTSSLRYAAVDLLIFPWGKPIRHFGFNLAWRRVRKQVLYWLDSIKPEKGLILTGHSLGGAIAFLAAYELADRGVDAVVTFGAPRPGMHGFAHEYNTRLCGSSRHGHNKTLYGVTRRYTNDTDMVPRVPPPLLYRHVGDSGCHLQNNGAIRLQHPDSFIGRLIEKGGDLATHVLGQQVFEVPGYIYGYSREPTGRINVKLLLMSVVYNILKWFGLGVWMTGFIASFLGILTIPLAAYDLSCHPSKGYIKSFFSTSRYKAVVLSWPFLTD